MSSIGWIFPEANFMNGCAVHTHGRELLVCESRSMPVTKDSLTVTGLTKQVARVADGGNEVTGVFWSAESASIMF